MAIFNSKLLVYQRVNDSAIFDANMVFWLIKFAWSSTWICIYIYNYKYIYIHICIYNIIRIYIYRNMYSMSTSEALTLSSRLPGLHPWCPAKYWMHGPEKGKNTPGIYDFLLWVWLKSHSTWQKHGWKQFTILFHLLYTHILQQFSQFFLICFHMFSESP